MQKTALDRWLQKKFVYVCKVYCNTLPAAVPEGAILEETTESSGGRYLYCITVEDDDQLNELTAKLEVANITYTSRVSEKGGLVGHLFNHPGNSFTLQVAWLVFIIAILAIAFSGLPARVWEHLSAEEVADKKAPKVTAKAEPESPVKFDF